MGRSNRAPSWDVYFDIPAKLGSQNCRTERDLRGHLSWPYLLKRRNLQSSQLQGKYSRAQAPPQPPWVHLSTAQWYQLGISCPFCAFWLHLHSKNTSTNSELFSFLSSYLFILLMSKLLDCCQWCFKDNQLKFVYSRRAEHCYKSPPKHHYLALQLYYNFS